MSILKNIPYSKSGHERHVLDIYLPECDEFPVLVYFHGGGIECGEKTEVEETAKILNQNGVAVVSANYRLYPNAKYPEFIEDAAQAVAWTFENINNYGKCNKIYVCGTSAGAYLSMMLCFDKKYLAAHGIDVMQIAGFIHNGGQPTAHFNVLRERGIDTRRVIVDDTAPLYHIGTESKYPPSLALVADFDMYGRYEQLRIMETTMKHFEHSNFCLRILQGGHCCYANYKLGDLIKDFILNN